MNPNANNLHGDHYGYGQVNNNPTSTLTNAPKGQSVSGLPTSNNGVSGNGSFGSIDNSNAPMMDHNAFAKATLANGTTYSKDNVVDAKETGNLKTVLIIGGVLLLLIVVAICCLIFLR